MGTVITPTYIQNFETNLVFRASNAWRRTNSMLWWPRLMLLQSTGSALEYVEWMLETARIQSTGPKGASIHYDGLAALSQTLRHEHFGNGLELYRADIEDDKVARAPAWATSTGEACAYWPQRLLAERMQNGKVTTLNGKPNAAYDGKAFFAVDHPINPYDVGLGTYSNLHVGTAFTAENLARVVAYIETINHAGSAPMGALPTITVFPTNYRYRANQYLGAEQFNDILVAGASASNVFKTAYGFEPPIFGAELNSEPTVWYVGIPAMEDAFDGAFGYLEREAFNINTYSPLDQASLADVQTFKWHNRGRNGSFYGHPYRFHRCESSGSQAAYLSGLSI